MASVMYRMGNLLLRLPSFQMEFKGKITIENKIKFEDIILFIILRFIFQYLVLRAHVFRTCFLYSPNFYITHFSISAPAPPVKIRQ